MEQKLQNAPKSKRGWADGVPKTDDSAGPCRASSLCGPTGLATAQRNARRMLRQGAQAGPFVEKRKRVMTQEASHILRVEQAVFEAVDHEVMIEEASVSYEITELVYEWVEEVVTVAPERKVLRSVPATFKTVKEKVLMAPARVEWKPGRRS
jgi:hypothetical protein